MKNNDEAGKNEKFTNSLFSNIDKLKNENDILKNYILSSNMVINKFLNPFLQNNELKIEGPFKQTMKIDENKNSLTVYIFMQYKKYFIFNKKIIMIEISLFYLIRYQKQFIISII